MAKLLVGSFALLAAAQAFAAPSLRSEYKSLMRAVTPKCAYECTTPIGVYRPGVKRQSMSAKIDCLSGCPRRVTGYDEHKPQAKFFAAPVAGAIIPSIAEAGLGVAGNGLSPYFGGGLLNDNTPTLPGQSSDPFDEQPLYNWNRWPTFPPPRPDREQGSGGNSRPGNQGGNGGQAEAANQGNSNGQTSNQVPGGEGQGSSGTNHNTGEGGLPVPDVNKPTPLNDGGSSKPNNNNNKPSGGDQAAVPNQGNGNQPSIPQPSPGSSTEGTNSNTNHGAHPIPSVNGATPVDNGQSSNNNPSSSGNGGAAPLVPLQGDPNSVPSQNNNGNQGQGASGTNADPSAGSIGIPAVNTPTKPNGGNTAAGGSGGNPWPSGGQTGAMGENYGGRIPGVYYDEEDWVMPPEYPEDDYDRYNGVSKRAWGRSSSRSRKWPKRARGRSSSSGRSRNPRKW